MKNKGNNLCTRNEMKGILDIEIRKRGQATRAPPPPARRARSEWRLPASAAHLDRTNNKQCRPKSLRLTDIPYFIKPYNFFTYPFS